MELVQYILTQFGLDLLLVLLQLVELGVHLLNCGLRLRQPVVEVPVLLGNPMIHIGNYPNQLDESIFSLNFFGVLCTTSILCTSAAPQRPAHVLYFAIPRWQPT